MRISPIESPTIKKFASTTVQAVGYTFLGLRVKSFINISLAIVHFLSPILHSQSLKYPSKQQVRIYKVS